MGFFDKVGSFLKREAEDLGDAADGVKDKFDQELTKREQELKMTPSEKIAALQQQASVTDAQLEAIAEKAQGHQALADAVAEVGNIPTSANLPNVTHIVLPDGRVRSGNDAPAHVVDEAGQVHDVPPVQAPSPKDLDKSTAAPVAEELPAPPSAGDAPDASDKDLPAPPPSGDLPNASDKDLPAPPPSGDVPDELEIEDSPLSPEAAAALEWASKDLQSKSPAAETSVAEDLPAPPAPVAPDTSMAEDLPTPPAAPDTSVAGDLPAPPAAPDTSVAEDLPAPPAAVAPDTSVAEDLPAPPVAPDTSMAEDLPAPPVAPDTSMAEDLPAPPAAPDTSVAEDLPAPPAAPDTSMAEDLPAPPPAAAAPDTAPSADMLPAPPSTDDGSGSAAPAPSPDEPATDVDTEQVPPAAIDKPGADYGKTPAQLKYERARAAANNLLDELRGELKDEGEI